MNMQTIPLQFTCTITVRWCEQTAPPVNETPHRHPSAVENDPRPAAATTDAVDVAAETRTINANIHVGTANANQDAGMMPDRLNQSTLTASTNSHEVAAARERPPPDVHTILDPDPDLCVGRDAEQEHHLPHIEAHVTGHHESVTADTRHVAKSVQGMPP